MKLTELAIDGYGICRNLRLGRFSDGLNIVFGETGAGKSTVRSFIRGVLFGFENRPGFLQSGGPQTAGELRIWDNNQDYSLVRDVRMTGDLHVNALDGAASGSSRLPSPNLTTSLFDAFFNIGFHDVNSTVHHVTSILRSRLNVPTGMRAVRDEAEYLRWQAEQESRRARLAQIQSQLDVLNRQRVSVQQEIERAKGARADQVNSLDSQIAELSRQLNALMPASLNDRITTLNAEIARLREYIGQNETRVEYVQQPVTNSYVDLYKRLDEIDFQIRRWRHVQNEVQQHRLRLRDEMIAWNNLQVESQNHPYHQAQSLLVEIEKKIDEAELLAKRREDGVTVSFDLAGLRAICEKMRQGIYGLCDELDAQFKSIRHRSATSELKQLRECYNEMTDSTDRLAALRQQVVEEIRSIDPTGAQAIQTGGHQFIDFAQQNGYFQARNRFVGTPIQGRGAQVQQVVHRNEMAVERARLAELERELVFVRAELDRVGAQRVELENRKAQLIQQRERLLAESNESHLTSQLQNIELQIRQAQDEYNALLRQVEADPYREFVPDPVLANAANYLQRMSLGELKQIWLHETVEGLVVRDRGNNIIEYERLSRGQKDLVYLAICLSAVNALANQGVVAPLLLDDVFANLDGQRVESTLSVIKDFALNGAQVIAFAKHNEIGPSSVGAGVTVFELPQTTVNPLPAVFPTREPQPLPGRDPLWFTSQQAAEIRSIEMGKPTGLPTVGTFEFQQRIPRSDMPRVYPLNKYTQPIVRPSLESLDTVPPLLQSPPVHVPQPSAFVAPAPIQRSVPQLVRPAPPVVPDTPAVVTPVGLVESSLLLDTELIDTPNVNSLKNLGIITIENLLRLDPTELPQGLINAGFGADQIDGWQAMCWLRVCVPVLTAIEAKSLVGCGITEPEQLESSDQNHLLQRVQRYLVTPEARHLIGTELVLEPTRIGRWVSSARSNRHSWGSGQGYSRRRRYSATRTYGSNESLPVRSESLETESVSPRARERAERRRESRRSRRTERPAQVDRRRIRAEREPRSSRTRRSEPAIFTPRVAEFRERESLQDREKVVKSSRSRSKNSKLKFYLDLTDHVEAAPSIGPRTAERFEAIGVNTIADFLKQTAESMASKIDYKRMSAEVIRGWQEQARLVCRIPNLRGHDAQLLVACGYNEPEDIAAMQPAKLFEVIGPFSETKEGLKIIRSGKKPDLDEITDWINWAGQGRSLRAA